MIATLYHKSLFVPPITTQKRYIINDVSSSQRMLNKSVQCVGLMRPFVIYSAADRHPSFDTLIAPFLKTSKTISFWLFVFFFGTKQIKFEFKLVHII